MSGMLLAMSLGAVACGPGTPADAGPDVRTDGGGPTDGDVVNPDEGPADRIVSIAVTPATAMTSVGGTTNFVATATRANGTTSDISSTATWTSSNTGTATINAMGVATGVANGTTMISASLDGINSNSATLTVAAAEIRSISLTPDNIMTMVGSMPTAIMASGTFSDGMTRNINGDMGIMWSSNNPMVATVDAMGNVTAVGAGSAIITVRLGTVMAQATVTVQASTAIRSIEIAPATATINAGSTQRFTVTATFEDGRTGDVTSMATFAIDNMNATLGMGADANVVTGRMAGMSVLTATVMPMGGMARTATANITINAARLRSIAIEPGTAVIGAGTTQTFRAVGTYEDGSSSELTTGVMWSSGTAATATVDAMTGVVTGVAASAMPVTITATVMPAGGMAVSGTATVLVSDSPLRMISATLEPTGNVAIGGTAQIRVQGTFADGMSRDLTANPGTGFMSAAAGTATVSGAGVVRGVAAGMTTITVTYMGQMATVPVTVAGTIVTGVDITPAAPGSLPIGATQAFTATARLSDGTTRDITSDAALVFASSNAMVATISNAAGATRGVASAVALGSTNITATYTPMGGTAVVSSPVPLSVIDAQVTAIEVTPRTSTTPAGFSVRFTATARLSDGTTRDLSQDPTVSWSSSDATKATISNLGTTKGIAQGVATGMATITATYNSGRAGAMPITGTATLTINAVTLASINVTPDDVRVGINTTRQYTATGVFSDGTTSDITEDVNWSVASGYTGGAVSSLPGTRGIFTAGAMPAARRVGGIVATKTIGTNTVTGTAAVTVTGPLVLSSIRLQQGGWRLPGTITIPQGTTIQLRAFGTFSDGVTSEEREITTDAMATWNTSVPANVTVSNAMDTKGQITAVTRAATANAANSQVSVTFGGFTSPVLTVNTTGMNCTVTGLVLTTEDSQIPGAAAQTTPIVLPANPRVDRAAPYVNQPLNNIGRGGTRSIYSWATLAGAGCAGPAFANLTESGVVNYGTSAMANATVSNAAGTRGAVSVPTTAPVTPAGGTGADITATFGTLQAQYQVIVTNACINTLTVTQLGGSRALPVGVAATFVVTGRLADGTDVTTTDNSLPANSVDITATGLGAGGVGFPVLTGPRTGGQWLPGSFTAANPGMGTIQAVTRTGGTFVACNAMMPATGSAMVTVNTARVTGVTVAPATASIPNGTSQDGFRATAAFDNMTTIDVTNVAGWTSSRTDAIRFNGNTSGGGGGLTVAQNNGSAAIRVGVLPGQMGNGTVTASFTQPAVGMTAAVTQSGVSNITFGGDRIRTITAVNSLSAANCARTNQFGAYPVGSDIQVEVRGTSSSGATNVLIPATDLEFSVSDTMRAAIDANGVLSFNMAGTVTVTARLVSDPTVTFTSPAFTSVDATLATISTVPAAGFTIPVGTTQPFTITGDFGMGSTACPIRQGRGVTWSALPTTNPGWSIGAMTGIASATATATPGAVTVIASYMGKMATTNGSIGGGCINSIELTLPAGSMPSIASDENLLLTPVAVRSDGMRTPITTNMAYSSSNPFTATVTTISNARGQVSAAAPLMPGMVTITGSYSGTGLCAGRTAPLTATQAVTVTDAVLRSIAVTCQRSNPNSATGALINLTGGRLVAGQLATCTARGTFSNGTTQIISMPTWRATGSGTVSTTGVATAGTTPGTLSLEAQSGSVIGTLNIPVVNGGTPTITIGSRPALPAQGAVLQINTGVVTRLVGIATYTYSAGGGNITEAYDVTEQAGWTSSQPTRVDVSNSAGSKGRTTGGANPGNSTITAMYGTEMGTVVIDNAEKVLVGIRTAFGTLNGGQTTTLTAGQRADVFVAGTYCPAGTMSGASCQVWDVTPIASLQIINTAVAALETTGTQPQVRGVAPVSTAVRGTLGMFNNDATVTVNPACIMSIALTPTGVNAVVAGTGGVESSSHTFTVTGTRSDGTTVVLTDPANMLTGNVFVNLASGGAAGWTSQANAANFFTARFPTAGMGTYTASFNGTHCGTGALASPAPATTVLASAGTLTGITVAADPAGAIPASTNNADARQFRATGTYTLAAGGSTTADLTFNPQIAWSATPTNVATHIGNGRVRGVAAGSATVSARLGNVVGSGTATVSAATLTGLFARFIVQDYLRNNGNRGPACNLAAGALSGRFTGASSWSLPVGGFKGRIVIEGQFSDGVFRDITDQVTFEMDNAYGSINAAGVVTTATTAPTGTLNTLITARSSVMTVPAITFGLSLINQPLQNVVVYRQGIDAPATPATPGPTSISANLGVDAPLYVVGLFGTANTPYCLTDSSTFASADTTKATVAATGVITPVAVGTSLITATAGGRNDTITATVAMAVPRFLALSPSPLSIAAGDSGQSRALLTFSDGSQQDVTFSGAGRIQFFETMDPMNAITVDSTDGGITAVRAGTANINACFHPTAAPTQACTGGFLASTADTSMVPAPLGMMGTRDYSQNVTVTP